MDVLSERGKAFDIASVRLCARQLAAVQPRGLPALDCIAAQHCPDVERFLCDFAAQALKTEAEVHALGLLYEAVRRSSSCTTGGLVA